MAAFHLFSSLPLELRIEIWNIAVVDKRVVKLKRLHKPKIPEKDYSSSAPAPGVTRASRESRKYCGYQKAFWPAFQDNADVEGNSHYTWVNFEHDIIQIHDVDVQPLADDHISEATQIRHLRIVTSRCCNGTCWWEAHDNDDPRIYPALVRCDIILHFDLYKNYRFVDFVRKPAGLEACPRENFRIVDAETGEWIGPDMVALNDRQGHLQREDVIWAKNLGPEVPDREERYAELMKTGGVVLPRMQVELDPEDKKDPYLLPDDSDEDANEQ